MIFADLDLVTFFFYFFYKAGQKAWHFARKQLFGQLCRCSEPNLLFAHKIPKSNWCDKIQWLNKWLNSFSSRDAVTLNHPSLFKSQKFLHFCLHKLFNIHTYVTHINLLTSKKTRTTIVVSNGRYTFYQIPLIKYHLSNTIYQILFIKYNLSNILYQIPFIKYHLSDTFYQIPFAVNIFLNQSMN